MSRNVFRYRVQTVIAQVKYRQFATQKPSRNPSLRTFPSETDIAERQNKLSSSTASSASPRSYPSSLYDNKLRHYPASSQRSLNTYEYSKLFGLGACISVIGIGIMYQQNSIVKKKIDSWYGFMNGALIKLSQDVSSIPSLNTKTNEKLFTFKLQDIFHKSGSYVPLPPASYGIEADKTPEIDNDITEESPDNVSLETIQESFIPRKQTLSNNMNEPESSPESGVCFRKFDKQNTETFEDTNNISKHTGLHFTLTDSVVPEIIQNNHISANLNIPLVKEDIQTEHLEISSPLSNVSIIDPSITEDKQTQLTQNLTENSLVFMEETSDIPVDSDVETPKTQENTSQEQTFLPNYLLPIDITSNVSPDDVVQTPILEPNNPNATLTENELNPISLTDSVPIYSKENLKQQFIIDHKYPPAETLLILLTKITDVLQENHEWEIKFLNIEREREIETVRQEEKIKLLEANNKRQEEDTLLLEKLFMTQKLITADEVSKLRCVANAINTKLHTHVNAYRNVLQKNNQLHQLLNIQISLFRNHILGELLTQYKMTNKNDSFVTELLSFIPVSVQDYIDTKPIVAHQILQAKFNSLYEEALLASFISPSGGILDHVFAHFTKFIYSRTGCIYFLKKRNTTVSSAIQQNVDIVQRAAQSCMNGNLYLCHSLLSQTSGLVQSVCQTWINEAEATLTIDVMLKALNAHAQLEVIEMSPQI